MSEKKFELGDYVEVKDRIKLFYELFGKGALVTEEVTFPDLGDGKARVMVRALAYRTPDDPHPGVGYSWLEVPGRTPYTNGSEIENAETSAWGRAIGSLGILIDRSIATTNEIENKAEPAAAPKAPVTNGDGSLIGTVEIAKDFPDFLPKQSPDGLVLAFKLVSPAGGIKVIAVGQLAEALAVLKPRIIGQRVSCWGRVRDDTFTPKGTKKLITYQVLDLERIKTPDGTLPAPAVPSSAPQDDLEGDLDAPDAPLDEPPADVELMGEAPSEELGLVP